MQSTPSASGEPPGAGAAWKPSDESDGEPCVASCPARSSDHGSLVASDQARPAPQPSRDVPSPARVLARLAAFALLLVTMMTALLFVSVSEVFDRITPWLEADLRWKAERAAQEMSYLTEVGMLLEDRDIIANKLGGYLRDADFDTISVTNPDGKVLFAHGIAPPATFFSGSQDEGRRVGDSIVAWTAKEVEGHPIGRVAVAVSTRRLLEGEQLRRRILTLSGGACAVALLMTFLFFRLHIGPLVRLTQSTLRALKELNTSLEARVEQRTEELAAANHQLEENLRQLRLLQHKLVDASRAAGMADVATNVLHNVGNILNSVNVSASVALDCARALRVQGLVQACQLVREHELDLADFLANDPKGRLLVGYLEKLATAYTSQRDLVVEELRLLHQNIEHIRAVIETQQSLAGAGDVVEQLSLRGLVDETLHLNERSLAKYGIRIVRDFDEHVDIVRADRYKLFQILVNLLSNARDALKVVTGPRELAVRIQEKAADRFAIQVQDTGCGIGHDHLVKVFSHGFSTKPEGHGFGLHASACAAQEMGGSLAAYSDGPGLGAVFTLELPKAGTPRKVPKGTVTRMARPTC